MGARGCESTVVLGTLALLLATGCLQGGSSSIFGSVGGGGDSGGSGGEGIASFSAGSSGGSGEGESLGAGDLLASGPGPSLGSESASLTHPEPTGVALFGMGLAGAAWLRRRSRKKR